MEKPIIVAVTAVLCLLLTNCLYSNIKKPNTLGTFMKMLCQVLGKLRPLFLKNLAKTFLFINISFFLALDSSAQIAQKQILSIGDAVPESLWSSNHTIYKDGNIYNQSLEKYRGKLLILDFWSTWCGPCIRSLPELDSIVKMFGDKVQVILVTKNTNQILSSFLKSNDYAKGVKLPFIINDSILNKHFPHRSISHQIFIDSKGIVKAITGISGATIKNIQAIVNGNPINFPLKDDFAPPSNRDKE
ncbi:TlpA family protein disulfide reductase [Pedobacter endophyticus]|uniref:TlpA family protein disulfide reductase n=1 Tax=Pedobacter endophyticus TaxID=2789740 RepID=A0A7U3Q3J8_9SPHI|nr:TlpA disulfide reductase family protein [Pedobacter endophyticus]QPH37873.1 TlpA family protein disulfide reductase [Pedobacter endophyticus]